MQEIIKYQEIDAKIKKLENELASSKNRKSASEMQQYLKDGQTKLIKIETVANNLTTQYEKAVKLYNDFVAKLETLSKSIESLEEGKVPELEKTLNNFLNNSETLEKNIALLASKIASANKEFETIMNNAKKAKHNLEVYKNNYNIEREKIEPQIQTLKEQLTKQKSKVSPTLLAKYNTKSESKLFPIFVPETAGKCGGCRMEVPAGKLSDLKTKGMIECENCGRIIYVK